MTDHENEGAGIVLQLPNPPWHTRPGDWAPTPWRPDRSPWPQRPVDLADRDQARELASALLDTMPAALREAAAAAYAASQRTAVELNAAQAELAALTQPAPPGLSADERGMRHIRRIGLASLVEELRRANVAANEATTAALDQARYYVQHHSARALLDQERRQIREQHEAAEALELAAQHREIALQNALGLIGSWLP